MAERIPARTPPVSVVPAALPTDPDCSALSPHSVSPPSPSQPTCIPRRVKGSGAVDSSERARHRRPKVPKWDREEADEDESFAGGSSVAPSEGSGGSCEPWSMEDHSAATATATPTPALASASPDAGLDELLADFAQLLTSSQCVSSPRFLLMPRPGDLLCLVRPPLSDPPPIRYCFLYLNSMLLPASPFSLMHPG
ncbi:unnamed protein product [Closterium sp. NIES-64]|nr:unnamed protein product [Closterium sp. NIES-64]